MGEEEDGARLEGGKEEGYAGREEVGDITAGRGRLQEIDKGR